MFNRLSRVLWTLYTGQSHSMFEWHWQAQVWQNHQAARAHRLSQSSLKWRAACGLKLKGFPLEKTNCNSLSTTYLYNMQQHSHNTYLSRKFALLFQRIRCYKWISLLNDPVKFVGTWCIISTMTTGIRTSLHKR